MTQLMLLWCELLGVIALSVSGVLLGLRAARLPGRYWMMGYLVPMGFVLMIGLERWLPSTGFYFPISWVTAGRMEFALFALLCPMLLVTPLSRLSRRRLKALVLLFGAGVLYHYSISVFLLPALAHDHLAGLKTTVDRDGVCRQSNGYTCGPAAAVTALRQFGITAEEGDLAVLARTSDALGTPPDVLANVLKRRYRDEGIAAHYRYMRDLSEVKPGDVFIAVVYFDFTTDHYVTVIEVHDDRLVVGDPLSGKRFMSREAFLNIWQRTGVVLRRS